MVFACVFSVFRVKPAQRDDMTSWHDVMAWARGHQSGGETDPFRFPPCCLPLSFLSADPEVLYLHAKACFDCDHKDHLGGFNIQTYLEMLQVRV